jgi:hypothetical protein
VTVAGSADPQLRQRIADALRRDGIAVTDFRDLFGQELWDELRDDVAPFVAEQEQLLGSAGPAPAHKDEFIVRRFQGHDSAPRFSLQSPWLRVGLSEAVLGSVNAYRGAPTKLFYLDNWFTRPYAQAEQRIASQRWHRDPEEEHVVKVFLYLADVDEDTGPFEYVKGSPSGSRWGDLWPWGSKDKNPSDEKMAAAVPAEDRITLTGAAGTMFFCDTGGFHRGGFAKAKPRVLSLWSYVSPGAQQGRRFAVDLEGREEELAAEARAALA